MMRNILNKSLVLTCISLCSAIAACINGSKPVKEPEQNVIERSAINKNKEQKSYNENVVLWEIFNTLNIESIKKKHGGSATSTFLSQNYVKHLFRPDTMGFYGKYFLVNQDANVRQAYIATLTIYAEKKPWRFANEDEILIELTSYSDKVKVLPGINISDKEVALYEQFGTPTAKEGNILFYQDDKGVILSVKVNQGIIESIKIGRYQKEDIKQLMGDITKSF